MVRKADPNFCYKNVPNGTLIYGPRLRQIWTSIDGRYQFSDFKREQKKHSTSTWPPESIRHDIFFPTKQLRFDKPHSKWKKKDFKFLKLKLKKTNVISSKESLFGNSKNILTSTTSPHHNNLLELNSQTKTSYQILVFIPTGKTITLEVTESDTVANVKAKIKEKLCFETDKQRLIFGGTQLKDDLILKDYCILKDSCIHLALYINGGGGDNCLQLTSMKQRSMKNNGIDEHAKRYSNLNLNQKSSVGSQIQFNSKSKNSNKNYGKKSTAAVSEIHYFFVKSSQKNMGEKLTYK